MRGIGNERVGEERKASVLGSTNGFVSMVTKIHRQCNFHSSRRYKCYRVLLSERYRVIAFCRQKEAAFRKENVITAIEGLRSLAYHQRITVWMGVYKPPIQSVILIIVEQARALHDVGRYMNFL